jgi:hypothetical protein
MVAFTNRQATYTLPYAHLRSVRWEGPSPVNAQESVHLRFGDVSVTLRGRVLGSLATSFESMSVAWVRVVRPEDLFRVVAGRIDSVEVLLPVSEPGPWSFPPGLR